MVKVDIWSEVTCPWCGLGSHRVERALARFEHADEVEVVHHSFPLSSGFPVGSTFSVRNALLRKHGMDARQAEAAAQQIEALAHSDTIFRAYFGKAQTVFSLEDLLKLADELGLDREQARQVLERRRYRQQAQDDARQAQRLGASGAPFIVIDGRYGVSGAQDSDTLLDLLRTAWTGTHPVTPAAGDAPVCGPDGCAVPERT